MAITCTLFSDPISSPSGVRNMSIDFVDAVEAGETIISQDVISPDVDLVITNVTTEDSTVYFKMTTGASELDKTVEVFISFVGSVGNAERYRLVVPIVPYLCR